MTHSPHPNRLLRMHGGANACIAVLDVGKTQKKLAIYDGLRQVATEYSTIDTMRQDDLDAEDVALIEEWFLERLRRYGQQYSIGAISISGHGATAVCVDDAGNPALPVIAYTNELDPSLYPQFFELMGDRSELQRTTATVEVGPLANVGAQLFWLKQRFGERWQRVRHILTYPQYFGLRLTGVAASDITYVGNHSFLWDFGRWDWSNVVRRLGIIDKMPPIRYPNEVLGSLSGEIARRTHLSPETIVTVGIHDSNAALLPYLLFESNDFVLNSTGTWCVAMRPAKAVAFNENELGKMVFFNISALGKPVKTSILMGGLEFDTYIKILREIHGDRPLPSFEAETYRDLLRERSCFILPSVAPGSGQFPDAHPCVVEDGVRIPLNDILEGRRIPHLFRDWNRAIATLDISLALQTEVALKRVGMRQGTVLYIEGGFRKNDAYTSLLATLFDGSPVRIGNLEEASCWGAAIVAKSAMEGVPLERFGGALTIDSRVVPAADIAGIDAYRERFLQALG